VPAPSHCCSLRAQAEEGAEQDRAAADRAHRTERYRPPATSGTTPGDRRAATGLSTPSALAHYEGDAETKGRGLAEHSPGDAHERDRQRAQPGISPSLAPSAGGASVSRIAVPGPAEKLTPPAPAAQRSAHMSPDMRALPPQDPGQDVHTVMGSLLHPMSPVPEVSPVVSPTGATAPAAVVASASTSGPVSPTAASGGAGQGAFVPVPMSELDGSAQFAASPAALSPQLSPTAGDGDDAAAGYRIVPVSSAAASPAAADANKR
jgi:hypothetical protein